MFGSDEDGAKTEERMYDSDGDFIYPKTKDISKDIIKTKPSIKPKTKTEDSIYTRIKYECKECHEEFRNKTALTTHSYSHNRKNLENTECFDTNTSQNMKEFFITDKVRNYIEDINEAINRSLEEIKKCFKYKITAVCEYKKRTKDEVKITKILFNTIYVFNNAIYEKRDFTHWLNFEIETYEVYGYDFEFFG